MVCSYYIYLTFHSKSSHLSLSHFYPYVSVNTREIANQNRVIVLQELIRDSRTGGTHYPRALEDPGSICQSRNRGGPGWVALSNTKIPYHVTSGGNSTTVVHWHDGSDITPNGQEI